MVAEIRQRWASEPACASPSELLADLCAVLAQFPVPAEVFGADGSSLFANRAFSEILGVDTGRIVGELNLLEDPYLGGQLGLAESLKNVFSGQPVVIRDLRVPWQEIQDRGLARGEIGHGVETYQDIACLPVRDSGGALCCVVALFVTKHVYQVHRAVISARQYIETRWRDEFDLDAIAEHAGITRYHLSRLFQRFLGTTPYRHYQNVKIEHIKQALEDVTLSIGEAFAACGVAYAGSYARAFRRVVGMTPTEFRTRATTDTPAPAHPQAGVLPTAVVDEARMFRIVDLLPIPVQVFRANGEAAFINQAVLRAWNVRDAGSIVGSYNLRSDPLVNDHHGLREHIERAFAGEIVLVPDIRVPLEVFWESYPKASDADDPGAVYTDILNFPIWDGSGRLSHVMSIFLTSRAYRGRPEVARAREYLENNWQQQFDAGVVAGLVRLSTSQLSRVFKQETGRTLYGCYQEIRVARLKELLHDPDLSVSQAFSACGLTHWGNASRLFKEKVGMTPTQYRAALQDERPAGLEPRARH